MNALKIFKKRYILYLVIGIVLMLYQAYILIYRSSGLYYNLRQNIPASLGQLFGTILPGIASIVFLINARRVKSQVKQSDELINSDD